MPGSLIGTEVLRVEDPDLLTGRARYVDDLPIDGILVMRFVRSPVAHARVAAVDVAPALDVPGVVAAFSAADLGLGETPAFMSVNPNCHRPPLAEDRVRFVGEPVAAVVATTSAAADDGVEAVVVDYEPLPAAVDPEAALSPGAPLLFDAVPSNLAAGERDAEPTDGAALFGDAEVVVRARIENQRVAVMPMEGDAIAVVPGPDGQGHDLTVHVSTQMPHMFWMMASRLLGMERGEIRVVAPFVGGGFGAKVGMSAEHIVVMAVARRLGRPVKWVQTRSENLVSMPHGRAQTQFVELGVRRDGTITGLRARVIGDSGAYAGFGGSLAMGPTRNMAQGVYRIPRINYAAAVAVTNTTPVGAFRGAGRPEAAAMLERIVDIAAAEIDMDPVEIRRRNFLAPDEFPYTTLMGSTYDNGSYGVALDAALEHAGYESLRDEQDRRRREGERLQLGIGIGCYVEVTAGGMASEYGAVEVHGDGTATIRVGTSAHGQGHATSFSMIVSDRLGIPMEKIRFLQSDTAEVPRGGGTGGSRSLQIGGNAVGKAAEELLERARPLAAELLEAPAEDIVVMDDGLGVAGVPARALPWSELARAAERDGEGLSVATEFVQSGATYPFGAHVSVVEVDTETGRVRPMRHIAVDDCGRILNPLIVTGQQQGGVAQGMAQVLWEQMVYDPEGNPLTSTLADYAMPSSAEVPSLETFNTETPTHMNPLGAKGIGESGTIGALASTHNAVVDALSHLGVRHIDMPATPERVWNAIRRAASDGAVPAPWHEPPAVFSTLRERPAAAGAADDPGI